MSTASYKMTEMIRSTSAYLIDRSEDVIFEYGAGTRDELLRTSAWEAMFISAISISLKWGL